jgi:hypothetical protein
VEGFLSGSDLLAGVVFTVVLLFVFDRGVVVDFAVDAAVVEPVDVVSGREFKIVNAAPRSFVQTNSALDNPIVASAMALMLL